ncbi:MAG TPA: F0F1 ATP synthase subunit A [Gemmatimonadaceae bacterium]|nr:F0F1 ATP synthase subunit A [Gemmatimonadaceae bacterium]
MRPAIDHALGQEAKKVDIILPHISDSDELDVPWLSVSGFRVIHLPHWAPIMIGSHALDLSPTKHVVMMLIAALLACVILISAARAQARHAARGEAPRGFAGTIEATVLYVRNEVILPSVGPHGEAFVPYLLSVFFFILLANLLGLVPYGSTATGNVSVTGTLAIIAFFVIEGAGIATLGWKYVNTIVYWPHDMPIPGRILMTCIMTPVELLGKFTKPFALTIRLFANMTAGHVMVLALISIIFTFGSVFIGLAPVAMAVGIMCLELFVAFLQAYVFTLLVASFIGQIRTVEGH